MKKGRSLGKILLMDDEVAFASFVATRLRRTGYLVDVAPDASQAKVLLSEGDYDVVIADIIVRANGRPLPDGGISLIGWMRSPGQKQPALRKVPIVAISGSTRHSGMENILTTAAGLGATATLAKPFEMDALLDLLEKIIERKDPAVTSG
jgi:CheY-like chemotaxis protein